MDFITAPSFRKEAKFAAAGSNILSTTTSSVSPFLFGIRIQVAQFLRKYDKYNTAQDFFQKGLYMLDIGQNNLVGGFYSKTLDQILASISIILSNLEDGLKELYDLGARNFWVHNTGSLGCLGQNIIKFKTDASKLDKLGCVSTTIWMWFRKTRLAQVGAFQDFNCQCISNLFTLSTLKKAGITPYVNLNHYDLPQALQNRYNGWLHREVEFYRKDFADYADFCFKMFQDRVKNWFLFNEPRVIAALVYDAGNFAPERCYLEIAQKRTLQVSLTLLPIISSYVMLLQHKDTVKVLFERSIKSSLFEGSSHLAIRNKNSLKDGSIRSLISLVGLISFHPAPQVRFDQIFIYRFILGIFWNYWQYLTKIASYNYYFFHQRVHQCPVYL
ncbi:putative protein isoform X1 [Capsicum chacoense]